MGLLDECRNLSFGPVQQRPEWNYLWNQLHDVDRSLGVSDESVHCVRFSPDGAWMIAGAEDGRVVLWDTATWTRRSEWNEGLGEVNVTEFSQDGKFLAVAGEDGRVVVHRASDLSVIYDEKVVDGRVFALCWLGPHGTLAVGGEDAVVSVVDPISHERRSTAPLPSIPPANEIEAAHPVEIANIAYLTDQDLIAVSMKLSGFHVLSRDSLLPVESNLRALRVQESQLRHCTRSRLFCRKE